jgi:pimeloyl-ACP methyl ester carboxylesterase
LLGVVLVYGVVSMVVVAVVYGGQFPRYDRPDMSLSVGLRYEDLEGEYPRELVNFESGDNLLQGYVYGVGQDRGLVVVAHGIGGGADSYLAQISYFVDQGWCVFAYDATGSFDSEGKSTRGFPQGLFDLRAALDFIEGEERFSSLPVLLFGHSWGGYAVANVLHFGYDVAGVVSVSGADSSLEMIIEQGRRMMGGFIDFQSPFLWLYEWFLFGNVASLRGSEAVFLSGVPVLVVHGRDDEFVSYDGASLYSKVEGSSEGNIRSLLLSEPGRSGHSDLFDSLSSLEYIEGINVVYGELYEEYDGKIPYEVEQGFYAGVDRFLANGLDLGLMGEINGFFLECVE